MEWPGKNIHETGTENHNTLKTCMYILIHFCLKQVFLTLT